MLPLRDPASANATRLVHAPASGRVSDRLRCDGLRRRVARSGVAVRAARVSGRGPPALSWVFRSPIALTGIHVLRLPGAGVVFVRLDDAWWPKRVRTLLDARAGQSFPVPPASPSPVRLARSSPGAGAAQPSHCRARYWARVRVPAAASRALEWLSPFGLVNAYGLFASMTTSRPEIIVEASMDGSDWRSMSSASSR